MYFMAGGIGGSSSSSCVVDFLISSQVCQWLDTLGSGAFGKVRLATVHEEAFSGKAKSQNSTLSGTESEEENSKKK